MRIAVLGCGSIGSRHLRNLRALGQPDLLVYDPSPAAREAVGEEAFAVCCETLEEVWAWGPEAVLVAAPTNLHVEMALEAARRGCHVFVEKPLSHSPDGLEQLCAEVERRGLITMVGCNMRFHPGPAAVRELVRGGRIGKVIAARIQSGSYLPRWRPRQDYHDSYSASPVWGGAALDCVHEIDLALWYFGPASVVGAALLSASTIGLETDGLAEILLRHEGGVLSSVHVNFIQRDYRRGCQIIGSEGTIYWDFEDRRVVVYGADGAVAEEIPEPDGWHLNQMYLDEMMHFIRAVETARQSMNPISGGWDALKIALAARSANS
jgi:predicted dehydrogenase